MLVAGFWILGAKRFEEAGLGVGCQKKGFTFGGVGDLGSGVLGLGLVLGPVLPPCMVLYLDLYLGVGGLEAGC